MANLLEIAGRETLSQLDYVGSLNILRGRKLPREQRFRLTKRQRASTPRDEPGCGHSTSLRLAIY